jgi:hypothetical protein
LTVVDSASGSHHHNDSFPFDFSKEAKMMVARWCIDAKFGYKQEVIELMKRWEREIAPQIGLSADQTRLLTGSIGALEATIQVEHLIQDLNELNQSWDKLAKIEAHKQWGKDLEPLVVSGTSRWEIYRLV